MPHPSRRPQAGPPLPIPAVVATALTVASAATFASGPRPSTGAVEALRTVQAHTAQVRAVGFLVFATAFPLAVLTAALYRRLRALGVTAPGAAIALVGGTLACGSLTLSGLTTWVTAQTAQHIDASLCRVLLDLSFATGAAGFAVPLALLIAGVAVPVLILRLAPRPLAWIGLVIAVIGVVSSATLLTDALDPTLPITRFGGLVWLVVIGAVLPTSRRRVRDDAPATASTQSVASAR